MSTEGENIVVRSSVKTISRTAKVSLACALLTGLVGCQAEGNNAQATKPAAAAPTSAAPSIAPWSCTQQSIHWGEARQKQVLVAASQLVKATKSMKGSSVEFSVIPVRTVKSVVQSTGKVDDEILLASLEKKTDIEAGELARPGKGVPIKEIGGGVAVHLEGQNEDYISAVGVTLVEASFVYGCASSTKKPIYGTVTTWHKPIAGLLECGTYPKKGYARQAYTLLCGEKKTDGATASLS